MKRAILFLALVYCAMFTLFAEAVHAALLSVTKQLERKWTGR